MLAQGRRDAVVGCFWDPMAVQICAEAEIGSSFRLRLGGKTGAASGEPLDLDVTVKGLCGDLVQESFNGAHSFGKAAWVECRGIDIVIVSVRQQTLSPSSFTKMGIDLSGKTLIAVKSSHHFFDEFSKLTDQIIHVATPGALQMDFASLPYTKRDLNYWPRVTAPLEAEAQP
jgi:microcystin degradation protein MlrC